MQRKMTNFKASIECDKASKSCLFSQTPSLPASGLKMETYKEASTIPDTDFIVDYNDRQEPALTSTSITITSDDATNEVQVGSTNTTPTNTITVPNLYDQNELFPYKQDDDGPHRHIYRIQVTCLKSVTPSFLYTYSTINAIL
jgi:hypothetical protein